ncbi:MAG: SDR family oxidoreductase [Fimbriimonadaceae bacterium]|nr:SDR family oxidoreductase [Fimbriimonadaceae bacterium]
MSGGSVLIVGATSPMARYAAEEFGRRGHDLVLAARDTEELSRLASDLRIRTGLSVRTVMFNADDEQGIPGWVNEVWESAGPWAGMVYAIGDMGDQLQMENEPTLGLTVFRRNYTSAAILMGSFGMRLAAQGSGFIVGVGSVAGDRGRRKNYFYGSAKAGFHAFMQGLRSRLVDSGVHVVTIKPGFVDTAMTFGMNGLFLVGDPREVGRRIAKAAFRPRDVVYIPGPWRWIMLIIRNIPERIFKKMSI